MKFLEFQGSIFSVSIFNLKTMKSNEVKVNNRENERFNSFKEEIQKEFFEHAVIINNPYTKWFKQGIANTAQVKDLILQFSVFSNRFIVIQAKRMINADTLEGEVCARAILLNECGVLQDVETGSIENQLYSNKHAHINWLRKIASKLEIDLKLIGKWETGTNATHQFLEQLDSPMK